MKDVNFHLQLIILRGNIVFVTVKTMAGRRLNYLRIKGTVNVFSSDPTCTDGNVRFLTVPLKALSDQLYIRTLMSLCFVKWAYFQFWFLIRKTKEIIRNKHFSSQKSDTFLITK